MRRMLLFVVLGSLYLAAFVGLTAPGGRALMMVHYGLFLLWQPYFGSDRRLNPLGVGTLLAFAIAALMLASGWSAVVWTTLLIGMFGGKVLTARNAREGRAHLLVLAFLLVLLLLWMVPRVAAPAAVMPLVENVVTYALPLLLAALFLLPGEEAVRRHLGSDLFYTLLFFQLAVLLVLGSLAFMTYTGRPYYSALLYTILTAAAALFVLGMLWNPYAGFVGLRTHLSRYLLSVGLPFETWLQQLAEIAETEREPEGFVTRAVDRLGDLPWVAGGHWNTPDSSGSFGGQHGRSVLLEAHGLEVTLFSKIDLGPAILLHTRLLVRLVGEFYLAKLREQQLRENAYMQAVHETGARLTHDIKNLLQSLYSLSAAGQLLGPEDSQAYLGMVQNQLPLLSKRLQTTLDRLQAPAHHEDGPPIPLSEWWAALEDQHGGRGVDFHGFGIDDRDIPRALFDSVAENLLENAKRKRLREPAITIEVELVTMPLLALSVRDTGSAVPDLIARRLFQQRVSGEAGMGIGLFQAHRQATQAGYRLALTSNRSGDVCFTLASESTGQDSARSRHSAAG